MSIVEKAAERLRESQRSGPRDARAQSRPHNATNEAGTPGSTATPDSGAAGKGSKSLRSDKSVVIDSSALRRVGLAPPQAVASQIAREYQRIKRPILASLDGSQPGSGVANVNRLMVASATSGEGKTFTSFNLALNLARERDYSVLLVDGDVIKPTITRALGLRNHQGLMDILADPNAQPGEAILDTDMPGLSFLPAGQRRDDTTELLSSRRMAWLVNELSADASRIVVFDSSPLLATSESQALALNMGQILMVVRAGGTERRAVEAALSLVASPNRPINLILNQSRKAHGDQYAGYYGMYYDGGSDA